MPAYVLLASQNFYHVMVYPMAIIDPFLVTSVSGICNFHNPNFHCTKIALEFIIPRLNPLVVVDFSFTSAFLHT